MALKKRHFLLLAINVAALAAFGSVFIARRNYEFLIYAAVIIVCLVIIAASFFKLPYTDGTLVGLTVWAILHMAGGAVYINDTRLYEIILIRLSTKYPIFRYDQFVHIWGFAASTLTMFCVLRPLLKENLNRYLALSVVVVMAGLGVGALNEIIEALVAAAIPGAGVGGYVNTALDLIADFIGAIIAMLYIRCRYLRYDNTR